MFLVWKCSFRVKSNCFCQVSTTAVNTVNGRHGGLVAESFVIDAPSHGEQPRKKDLDALANEFVLC